MSIRKTLFACVLIAGTSPALAQDMRLSPSSLPGSSDQQAACRPDVRRHCRNVKPDAGSMGYLACLKQHRDKLSKGCQAVLSAHGH